MSKLKLLVVAAIAVVAVAAFASSASAFRATVSRGGAISSVSAGKITFGNSAPRIECNLTLNGSLLTSFEITANTQMGEVTEVRIANCSGGEVERVLNLPWRITVNTALGRGPDSYTGILFNIVNAAFNLNTFFRTINCLYSGTAGALLSLNDTGTDTYTTAGIRALETVQLPLSRGGELCPREGSFAGTFGLSPQQSITVA